MENMEYYNKFAVVPVEAQKGIGAGRLKGMTDINPMWRIMKLTEAFGMCGFGWKYEIVSQRLEAGDNDSVCAFVDINLYVKVDGEWSAPIPGIGGASYIANERNGKYTSDECFKMALTDALSVACKALGVGADVYWEAGRSKYTAQGEGQQEPPKQQEQTQPAKLPHPYNVIKNLCVARGISFDGCKQQYQFDKTTPPERLIEILEEMGAPYNG